MSAFVALILLGCGASHEVTDAAGIDAGFDAPSPDAGPDLDALRAWLRTYRAAACGSLVNCPERFLTQDEIVFAREVDVCRAGEVASTPFLVAHVADGTIAFDADAAAACLTSARSGGCACAVYVRSDATGDSPCNHVFVETSLAGAAGDRCGDTTICGPGLLCHATPAPSSAGCAGARRCVAPAPFGSACDATTVCASSTGEVGVCTTSVCSDPPPLAGAGETCGGFVGMPYVDCMAGLYCTNVVYEVGPLAPTRCGAPLHDGDVCPAGFQDWTRCPGGSTCAAAGSGAPYLCTPLTVQRSAGAPCTQYGHDGDFVCDQPGGLTCGADATCHVIEHIAAGGACGAYQWCTDPLQCDATGHCVPPSAAGTPCRHAEDCASGVCGTDGLCADCPAP